LACEGNLSGYAAWEFVNACADDIAVALAVADANVEETH